MDSFTNPKANKPTPTIEMLLRTRTSTSAPRQPCTIPSPNTTQISEKEPTEEKLAESKKRGEGSKTLVESLEKVIDAKNDTIKKKNDAVDAIIADLWKVFARVKAIE
jgi:hypothetical protein